MDGATALWLTVIAGGAVPPPTAGAASSNLNYKMEAHKKTEKLNKIKYIYLNVFTQKIEVN